MVGASALGIAQAAYEWTLEYLDGHSEAGVPLLQTQRIQQTLADVATEIEAARLLVQRAAWMGRNGVPMTGGQGSMSKLKAGDVTMWATTTLMDLVGPYAWSTECPLEKFFRDAKIYQLFEGTAEIQRMVISRMQAREYAERLAFGAEVAAKAIEPQTRAGPRVEDLPRRSKLGGMHSHRALPRPGCAAVGQPPSHAGALAINVAMLGVEAVGGFLSGSLAVLADAGHLLSDVGSIRAGPVRRRPRFAPSREPAHLRLPALGGSGGAGQRPASGRRCAGGRGRRDRPTRRPTRDRRRRQCSCSAQSVWPVISPPPWSSPGVRGRTSTWRGSSATALADALGSLGVLVAGAFVLAGGSSVVDPIIGLLISALILASSWRLIKEPLDVLMEAAPSRSGRRRRSVPHLRGRWRALGPRSPRLDAHRRFRARLPPTSSSPRTPIAT